MTSSLDQITSGFLGSSPLIYEKRQFTHLLPYKRGELMHYRNGREAKNGDKIVQIGGYGSGSQIVAVGVLYDAKPGSSYCNGNIAPIQSSLTSACLCDCLHLDDLAEILKEKQLDKRPEGK